MTEQNFPVISFKDFSFQYRAQKKPTLTGINLDIYPGERVLIAGPSGSGKSTLAGCINGLNPFSNPGELIFPGVAACCLRNGTTFSGLSHPNPTPFRRNDLSYGGRTDHTNRRYNCDTPSRRLHSHPKRQASHIQKYR